LILTWQFGAVATLLWTWPRREVVMIMLIEPDAMDEEKLWSTCTA